MTITHPSFFRSATIMLFAVMFVGCDADSDHASLPSFELSTRSANITENKPPKRVRQMKEDDVLVAINGHPLTRAMFDKILLVKAQGLREEKLSEHELNKRLEEFASRYTGNFVAQRLIVDEAFRDGVVSTNEVEAHVEKQLSDIAESRNTTVKELTDSFGTFERYYRYEIAISYIMEKFVKEKIPPVVNVDEDFVETVKRQIHDENAAAQKTNALVKAQMVKWRAEIASGGLDFATIAKRHPPILDEYKADGTWGVFAKEDFDDSLVGEAVFALKENQMSDVIETDDNFYILKLISVSPAIKDEAGNVTEEEHREVAAIMMEKTPLSVEDPDDVLTQDLQGQMQVQAVNSYLNNLLTNGTNKVVYPNGKRLF